MAYVADQDQNQSTVASSTPLDSGAGQAAQEQPSQEGPTSAPTPVSTGASSVEAASQGQTQSKKPSGGASSGMFTNIQKYVQKNRPQAQKMSQAVTQDVGEQAGAIRQAAEKKQADTQAQLDANKAAMESARTGAESAVANITGGQQPTKKLMQQPMPAQQTGRVSGEQQMREAGAVQEGPMSAETFQDLMSGNIAGTTDVQDINLAQQNMRSKALQNLAKSSRTEQGRKNLLRGTFGDQGEYTRGMSGLDQLIVGGDKAAREGLIGGVEGQASQLGQDLKGIQSEAGQDVAAQRQAMEAFGGEITDMATGAQSGIVSDIDKSFADELANRAALTGDYEKAVADMQAWKDAKLSQLGDVEDYSNVARQILESGNDLAWRGRDYFTQAAESGLGTGSLSDKMTNRISEDRFKAAMQNIMDSYKYGGDENLTGVTEFNPTWSDIWKQSKSSNKSSADQYFTEKSIQDAFRNMKSSIEGLDPTELLKQRFAEENKGQTYDDYISGVGLDKYDTASEQDIEKLSALQNLMGTTGGYSPEQRQTDYTKTDVMQNLLNKYKGR